MRHPAILLSLLLAAGCAGSLADGVGPGPPPEADLGSPSADMGFSSVTFLATTVSAGGSPRWVAVGDVDQDPDRLPDIVVADGKDDTVRVLRNRQMGRFLPADQTTHPVDKGPAAVAIGDVGGDGKPDLVVSCAGADAVNVLINQGGGVFPTMRGMALKIPVAAAPAALLLADLDGGMGLDLALVHGEGELVSVLLNGGTGLQAPRSYAVGRFLYGLAPLLARAGPPDLLVAIAGTDTVAVLRNSGAGAFLRDETTDLRAGPVPVAVYSGDLDGDGRPDVAVVNHGSDSVSVLIASGTRYVASLYATGSHPVAIAAGDLSGDGLPDLLVANQDSDDLTLLVNRGSSFEPGRVAAPIGQHPVSLAIADLDLDGRADVVVASQQGGEVTVLRVLR